jgi:transposase InsO family protein
MWSAPDRTIDAAASPKAPPRRRRLAPDLSERRVAAVGPNVLDRSFEAPAPNRKWIADFTYMSTAEGWLYMAAVVDLFSRRVVGWSMNAAMTVQLVTDALVMAIWRRGPPALAPGPQSRPPLKPRLHGKDPEQTFTPGRRGKSGL